MDIAFTRTFPKNAMLVVQFDDGCILGFFEYVPPPGPSRLWFGDTFRGIPNMASVLPLTSAFMRPEAVRRCGERWPDLRSAKDDLAQYLK